MDHLSTQNSREMGHSRRLDLATCGSAGAQLVLLVCILVLLAHCTPWFRMTETVPNRPATRVFKASPALVRKAVERVLMAKEFSLDTERSTYSHLETEWLQDGRVRSMVKVDLEALPKGRSRLTLHLFLQRRPLWQEVWQPVDKIGKGVYKELMEYVVMEIYRVLYNSA